MSLEYEGRRVVLPADLQSPGLDDVLAERPMHCDMLLVPHHGSKTSSTGAFLDLARPAFAVMSAGFENSYGHPHTEVLERYQERLELFPARADH